MKIRVEGTGKATLTPDEVRLQLQFCIKADTYQAAFEQGIEMVNHFIEQILIPYQFKKEDLKTNHFIIREELKYNDQTNKSEPDGFSYYQLATLKFDVSRNITAQLIESISKLNPAPSCQIQFAMKDKDACRDLLLTQAFQDAHLQALVIATAASKQLKQCQKVDFKPFHMDYISNTTFMMNEKMKDGARITSNNVFTPEDIEVEEHLYCLWIAE